MALIIDRGVRKVRVNVFKDGRMVGFLKPVGSGFFDSGSKWEEQGCQPGGFTTGVNFGPPSPPSSPGWG